MDERYTLDQGMKENILGTVTFKTPWNFTYNWIVAPQMVSKVVRGVVKLTTIKTGCIVLSCEDGTMVVVPPGYMFCVEEPQQTKIQGVA